MWVIRSRHLRRPDYDRQCLRDVDYRAGNGRDAIGHWRGEHRRAEQDRSSRDYPPTLTPLRGQNPGAALAPTGWDVLHTSLYDPDHQAPVPGDAETPDEGRLVEPLFDPKTEGEKPPMILAAGEPILILVRTANHPVDWALTARIWTEDVKVAGDRPWRMMADAIHGSGIPIMTVDEASTDEEVGCQLVLLAHWHGYISADEDGLVGALIQAYPGPVRRIRSKTDQPDMAAAATLLLSGYCARGSTRPKVRPPRAGTSIAWPASSSLSIGRRPLPTARCRGSASASLSGTTTSSCAAPGSRRSPAATRLTTNSSMPFGPTSTGKSSPRRISWRSSFSSSAASVRRPHGSGCSVIRRRKRCTRGHGATERRDSNPDCCQGGHLRRIGPKATAVRGALA